jgi:hypothetical protein
MTACPHCKYSFAVANPCPFGVGDWVVCDEPALMKQAVALARPDRAVRKFRLLACAIAQRGFADSRDPCLELSVTTGIALAEGRCDDAGRRWVVRELHRLAAGRADVPPWLATAWRCVVESAGVLPAECHAVEPAVVADCYREIFLNPFIVQLADPDWQTPDVLRLAERVAAEHRFDWFPDLADALASAGCNDDRLLDHLRQDRPHAVGCWALDLVLGRS